MEDQALFYPSEPVWQGNVALEMWIDAEQDPVRVRLIGILNQTTWANLVSTLKGLIADGCRNFEFETAVHMSELDRANLLAELNGIVQESGARLKWDEATGPWLAGDPLGLGRPPRARISD